MTSAEAVEAAGAILLDLRTGGLVLEELPDGSRGLRCYLPPPRSLGSLRRAVRARLASLGQWGLDPHPARITVRRVPGERWATAWRAHARPVRVGRLLVRPSWLRVPAGPRDVVLEIDPGMAFGTGTHPSTRLCLAALLRTLRAERRGGAAGPVVLDVGTGSGILAIAAARLGARVWASDIDPVAVAAARSNARANRVAGQVRIVRAAGLPRGPRADVIVINIVADAIAALLPAVRHRLASGGACIGSGIVAERLSAVRAAARTAGLRVDEILADGEWRAVVLRPSAARARRRPSGSRRDR